MRVVLDANVLIAAYAARGLCEAVFELCLANDEVVATTRLLADVRSKLVRKLRMPPIQADEIVAFLADYTRLVDPAAVPPGVCRDADDHDVLGAAQAAQADYIVTGDKDLLVLGSYAGIPILPPRGYWEVFGKRKPEGGGPTAGPARRRPPTRRRPRAT